LEQLVAHTAKHKHQKVPIPNAAVPSGLTEGITINNGCTELPTNTCSEIYNKLAAGND